MARLTEFRFLITNLDNAAFEDDQRDYEVARLLRQVADGLENGVQMGNLRDVNGNHVGDFGYKSEGALP